VKHSDNTMWRGGTHPVSKVLVVSYLPMCILIATLTPHNVLDYTWARSFADSTAHLIPLVAKVRNTASLPELYFIAAATNLTAMIYTLVSFCLLLTLDREFLKNRSSKFSRKDKVRMLLAVPFAAILFQFVLYRLQPSEPTMIGTQFMLSSKFGTGIYGGFLFGVWYLLVFVILVVCILFKQHFQKKDGT
jgi:hypothetical protein